MSDVLLGNDVSPCFEGDPYTSVRLFLKKKRKEKKKKKSPSIGTYMAVSRISKNRIAFLFRFKKANIFLYFQAFLCFLSYRIPV